MGVYAIIIFLLVLFYTFYVGFNDGSTAIATTVVSRAVTPRQAIILGAITKFVVPIVMFLIGTGSVASNINDSLIFNEYFVNITEEQGKGPSRDWLLIAKTSSARSKIRQWFKKEKREDITIQLYENIHYKYKCEKFNKIVII